jgi:cation transport regulator ChaC
MSMNKIDLLRRVVKNLGRKRLVPGTLTNETFRQLGFARSQLRMPPGEYVGVLLAGGEALTELTEAISKGSPKIARGVPYSELSKNIFNFILETYLEKPKDERLNAIDLSRLETQVEEWFRSITSVHEILEACAIARTPAAAFSIGPIVFRHLSEFAKEMVSPAFAEEEFKRFAEAAARESTFWIARVSVSDCTEASAHEIGGLAIDVALTGLQLVIPLDHSQRFSRSGARALPKWRLTISRSNGRLTTSSRNDEPGAVLGDGAIADFLAKGAPIITSVGNRVSEFVNGTNPQAPSLSQAWCDAAYWFHEGIAEPLDTIAVPKLETAIEVLLRAASSSGSKGRLLSAIEAFYGLRDTDLINPNSETTVKQFVMGLVEDRSRVLHGTYSTLHSQLPVSRSALTPVVQFLLANYTVLLDDYLKSGLASDDTAEFLAWIDRRRKTISEGSLWVFGYGSLMWDDWYLKLGCIRRVPATLKGFRRAFNKPSVRNWGTPGAPGPTLNLEPSENLECNGMAFEFADSGRGEVLKMLAAREGKSFSLDEMSIEIAGMEATTAIVALHHGETIKCSSVGELAKMVVSAKGTSGKCTDYVKSIATALDKLDIHDEAVTDLAAAVVQSEQQGLHQKE